MDWVGLGGFRLGGCAKTCIRSRLRRVNCTVQGSETVLGSQCFTGAQASGQWPRAASQAIPVLTQPTRLPHRCGCARGAPSGRVPLCAAWHPLPAAAPCCLRLRGWGSACESQALPQQGLAAAAEKHQQVGCAVTWHHCNWRWHCKGPRPLNTHPWAAWA